MICIHLFLILFLFLSIHIPFPTSRFPLARSTLPPLPLDSYSFSFLPIPPCQVHASSSPGASSAAEYSFASGNEDGIFKIGASSGVVGVALPAKLDFETKPRLRLIVIAQATAVGSDDDDDNDEDDGDDAIFGYATIWVNLRDVNDKAPVFSQDKYSSATWEGVQPGRYVVQVSDDLWSDGAVVLVIVKIRRPGL